MSRELDALAIGKERRAKEGKANPRSGASFSDFDELAKHFSQYTLDKILANAKKAKLPITSELIKTLDIKHTLDGNGVPKFTISFNAYGRYIEMRELFYSKFPPVDGLIDWVKRKGIGAFKYVPGYQNSTLRPISDRAAARIAWGIAVTRKEGSVSNQYGKNRRRKVWKQKALNDASYYLLHLASEYLSHVATSAVVENLSVQQR